MDWSTIILAVYVAASLAVKAIVLPLVAVVALGHTLGEAVRERRSR